MADSLIRPGTADDAEEIARIHVASWRETYAGVLPSEMLASLDVAVRREMWASVLSDDRSQGKAGALILEQAGRAIGFAAYGDQRSPDLAARGFDGEVGAVYILSQARKFGAGRRLMAASAAALAGRGKSGVSLWVLAENRDARAFYERLRGKLTGERSERTAQTILAEVAYGWPDLSSLSN